MSDDDEGTACTLKRLEDVGGGTPESSCSMDVCDVSTTGGSVDFGAPKRTQIVMTCHDS